MTRIFVTHKVLWLFLFAIFVGAILCGFLWMQGRYDVLATRKAFLVREVSALRGEVVTRELENRELSSLDRISSIAPQIGLDYEQVPRKVKSVEGR